MSFKDLMAKERSLKEKSSTESSNLEVKSSPDSVAASSSESESKKK
jgi:hypothetical protein